VKLGRRKSPSCFYEKGKKLKKKKKSSVEGALQQCLPQSRNEITTLKTMIEKNKKKQKKTGKKKKKIATTTPAHSILVIKLSVRRTEIALACMCT